MVENKCTEESRVPTIRLLSIMGQIEGHFALPEGQKVTRYEEVLPCLQEAEADPAVGGILAVINTLGGDVECGMALAELMASLSKPIITLVAGGGHSIGVALAVAGCRSFIVPSATMTLHPVRLSGTVIGAPQTYRYMRDMQARITRFVCKHSHIKQDDFTRLLMTPDELSNDIGSVIEGEEAVKLGLIDELGGWKEAMTALRKEINDV